MSRKRKSKGFKMKSSLKQYGPVIGALGRFSIGYDPTDTDLPQTSTVYEYTPTQAIKDIKSGKYTREEAMKKIKESMKQGKQYRDKGTLTA